MGSIGSRLLTAAVVLATVISAVLLGVMLAAPFLSTPGGVQSSPPASPSPSASTGPAPPIGLFVLRDDNGRGRQNAVVATIGCLAIELRPESYPAAEGAHGTATVLAWDRGVTDFAHPDACRTRRGEITTVEASVSVDLSDEDPPEPIGYIIDFMLTSGEGSGTSVELTILARRSTPDLLQAVSSVGGGEGMVFDRVVSVDPPLAEPPSGSPSNTP